MTHVHDYHFPGNVIVIAWFTEELVVFQTFQFTVYITFNESWLILYTKVRVAYMISRYSKKKI